MGRIKKRSWGRRGQLELGRKCTGGSREVDDGRRAKRRCWRRALYLGIPTSSQLARFCSLSHGSVAVRLKLIHTLQQFHILVHATVAPPCSVQSSTSIPFSARFRSPISSLAGMPSAIGLHDLPSQWRKGVFLIAAIVYSGT